MKRRLAIMLTLAFLPFLAGSAQRRGTPQMNAPRANQGRIPPAPTRRAPSAGPEVERDGSGRVNAMPHVNNNRWYGHDQPNDRRYALPHPFEHGHFANVGASFRYPIVRFDAHLHRFWLPGGFFFEVALWDWPLCADWCWTCGDDFVIYDDPDHPGWYLLYNVYTGVYVHVQYMGA